MEQTTLQHVKAVTYIKTKDCAPPFPVRVVYVTKQCMCCSTAGTISVIYFFLSSAQKKDYM